MKVRMRVFKITDCNNTDYFSGENMLSALNAYLDSVYTSFHELDHASCEITEVARSEFDLISLLDEEDETIKTLYEFIKMNPDHKGVICSNLT